MKIALLISLPLLALIGFALYRASAFKTIRIEKSVTIKGSADAVFDMVRYLKNFPRWSPFLVQDPSQKYEVKGTDGQVGAQYHWLGNGGKDVGYQEIVKIEPNRFIGLRCDIQKPFVAKPTFDYSFHASNGSVEVRQVFQLESGLVDAFFMMLFGAKAEMEKTNEHGLQLLKKAAEQK